MVSGAGGRYPFHRVARRGHILQAGIDELSEARQRLSRLAEQVLRTQNRWFEAISEYEAALASNPNFVVALNGLDWRKLHAGLLDEVTPLAQQALRRSPRRPPDRCLVQRCRDGASAAIGHRRGDRLARKSAQRRPAKPFNHINLTAPRSRKKIVEIELSHLACVARRDPYQAGRVTLHRHQQGLTARSGMKRRQAPEPGLGMTRP